MKKLLLFSLLISSFSIYSQTLDTTFGNSGIATHQYSTTPSNDLTYAAAMQSDGKMIYVGRASDQSYSFVARVNVNGQFDTTFNNYGFVKLVYSGLDNVIIQVDGKIVVSGLGTIFRLNNNGSYDTTFNSFGSLSIVINNQNFYSKSIIEQGNGKILVSGYANNGTNNDFAIVRLNSDGSYDTNFDGDGKALFPIGTANDESYGMAVQVDGKIILTGQTNNGSNYDFATIRLNNNGSIDTSFANLGKAIVQFSGQDYGRSVDIQSDGKIVVVGSGTVSKLYILKYTVDGTLDATFDNDGILASNISLTTSTTITSVSLNRPRIKCLNNNKILISGISASNFALIQLNSNGSLDNSFGTNGFSNFNAEINDYSNFLILSGNKIITGGGSIDSMGISKMQKIQFSDTGIFENSSNYSISAGSDNIIKMFEQPSGKIIALLDAAEGQSLRRYNVDGSLDTTFGTNGIIDNFINTIFKIEQQDGKILISFLNELFYIYRYTIDGQLDTTFGNNGIVDFSLNTPNYVSFVDKVYYDNNTGFIYVAFDYDEFIATNPSPVSRSFGILRLNNNGIIDTNFGNNGFANMRFDYYDTLSDEFPSEITIQSSGKIIVSGFLNTSSGAIDSVIGITRFNTNGTLDTTFGNNGKVIANVGNSTYSRQLLTFNDDKFIVNARSYINNIITTTSIKYNSNGTLDTNFGTNGIIPDGNYNPEMILQPDGKIIKAGKINSNFGIKRFNSNGSSDSTFGNSGTITTPINFNSEINEILFLQNGKLLAGGSSFNGTNTVATFAKYTDITLGNLDFTENKNPILIYPNPIQSEATFTYNLVNDETVSIDIIDLQGKIVQSVLQNKFQIEGSYNQTITLSNTLAAGNYILKFSSSTGSQSIKIIKKD